MSTKTEEIKALQQIRKIIADLGEDSYIGTAFEGCFEIAEQNIENDWGCSMKERAEKAEENEEYFHRIANDEAAQVRKLEAKLDELNATIERMEQWTKDKNARIDELNAQIKDGADTIGDLISKTYDQEQTIEAQKTEIMTLKAKLYDLMTAERSA